MHGGQRFKPINLYKGLFTPPLKAKFISNIEFSSESKVQPVKDQKPAPKLNLVKKMNIVGEETTEKAHTVII